MSRQPCPLSYVVYVGHSRSTLASLSFWLALNNALSQIKILFPTLMTILCEFSLLNSISILFLHQNIYLSGMNLSEQRVTLNVLYKKSVI